MPTITSKNTNKDLAVSNSLTPLFAKDYNVYINHTDAGGIVYHANHLTFFENCRRDWFGHLGLNGYFLKTDDGDVQHFVVSQALVQYKQAILIDDVVSVHVDKIELKSASVTFHQSIHRNTSTHSAPNSNTLLTSGKIVMACVQNQIKSNSTGHENTSMRPVRLPKNLRSRLEQAINEQINAS